MSDENPEFRRSLLINGLKGATFLTALLVLRAEKPYLERQLGATPTRPAIISTEDETRRPQARARYAHPGRRHGHDHASQHVHHRMDITRNDSDEGGIVGGVFRGAEYVVEGAFLGVGEVGHSVVHEIVKPHKHHKVKATTAEQDACRDAGCDPMPR